MEGSAKSFWYYFFGTVFFPHQAFRKLTEQPRSLAKGLKSVLLIGLLYTLTVAGFAVSGAVPMIPSWIPIPSQNFYFWEIFFVLPTLLLAWILSAATSHLLGHSHRADARPGFANNLAAAGFAITLPLFIIWVPVTAAAVLMLLGMSQVELVDTLSTPEFWQSFALFCPILAVFWMFLLFATAASAVQKARFLKALLFSLVTVAIFVAVVVAVIR